MFTTSNGMKNVGFGCLTPDLKVCDRAAGSTATACAVGQIQFTAPAVIYSTGKNTLYGPVGADEVANTDNNVVFVAHEPRPAGAPGGEFDDMVIWLSPMILYNRLVAAGAV